MQWRWLLVAPVIGLACGGTTAGGDGGSGGDGSSGGGCPASFPSDGTTCSQTGLECEYPGTAQFCSRLTSCHGTFTHSDGVCGMPPGGMCPATKAQVMVGQACNAAITCDYPDGRCGCVFPAGPVALDGGGLTWKCTVAPASCPTERPLLGTACSTEGQTCDYGACSLGGNGGMYSAPLVRRCTGGVWVRTAVPCPQ
jgi:hypothetical protein